MLLVGVALAFFALFLTLQLAVIPRLERLVRQDVESTLVRRAARLYVAYLGRSMAASAAIVAGIALAGMLGLMLLPIESAATSAALIRRVADARRHLSAVPPLAYAVLALASTALLVLTVRATTRRRVAQIFESAMRDVLEGLARDRSTGLWVELPPTADMLAVERALEETDHLAQEAQIAAVPEPVRQARLLELERRRAELIAARERLDVKRRVTDDLDLGGVVAPVVPGLLAALRPPWLRPGALASITWRRRLMLTLGLLLAYAGTIGALSPVGAAVLDERLNALDESAIEAAERYSLSKLFPNDGRQAIRGPREEAIAADMRTLAARSFEVAFGQFLIEHAETFRSNASTREQVLIDFASSRRSAQAVDAVAALEELEAGPHKAAVDWVLRRGETHEPITAIGRRFTEDGEALAKRYPMVFDRLAQNDEHDVDRIDAPPPVTALQPLLVSQAVGEAITRGAVDAQSPVASTARDLRETIGAEALETLYQLKSRQFNTTLADSNSIDNAALVVTWAGLDRMRKPDYLPLAPTLAQLPTVDLKRPPGSLAPPTLRTAPAPEVDVFRARGVLTSLRGGLGYRDDVTGSWRLTTPLSEFDDWFPAQSGSERRSERGKLLAEWGVKLVDPGLFSRGRSLPRLTDAARGAGLLIGQPPLSSRVPVDLRELRWSAYLQLLELNVVDGQGTITALGAFPRATIAAALAYAADGRPMALAVSSANPLPGRRAMLHPALSNSPLGCRMELLVERLDAFARTKISDPLYDQFTEAMAIYTYAWALRARLVDQVTRLDGAAREYPDWVRSEAEQRLADPQLDVVLDRLVGQEGGLTKNGKTLFKQMPDYFDPWLVEALEECAGAPDRSSLESCLNGGMRRWVEHRATGAEVAWWLPPPEVDVGVYITDAPYALDAALTALRMPAEGDYSALVQMLEVRVAATMTSPALKVPLDQPGKGGEDAMFGRAVWPLPALGDRAARALLRTIAESPDRRALVESLVQFVVLQRLFRLAFDGQLGPRFQTERLVALSRLTTRSPIVPVRTWRWYDAPGVLERGLASTLDSSLGALDRAGGSGARPAWVTEARRDFAACADQVRRWDAAQQNLAEVSDEEWSQACVFGAPPVVDRGAWAGSEAIVRAMGREASAVRELRRLRRALGVHRDDTRVLDATQCPPG